MGKSLKLIHSGSSSSDSISDQMKSMPNLTPVRRQKGVNHIEEEDNDSSSNDEVDEVEETSTLRCKRKSSVLSHLVNETINPKIPNSESKQARVADMKMVEGKASTASTITSLI